MSINHTKDTHTKKHSRSLNPLSDEGSQNITKQYLPSLGNGYETLKKSS